MDEKKKDQDKHAGPSEPKSYSAFARRDSRPAEKPEPEEKPIPSQPRSFSPVRPQRNAVPRKDLTAPAAGATASSIPSTKEAAPEHGGGDTQRVNKPATSTVVKDPGQPKSSTQATPAPAASVGAAKPGIKPKPASAQEATTSATGSTGAPGADPKGVAADAGGPSTAVNEPAGAGTAAPPPQSSGAGGDTIRLRVQPRPHARTLNTAPGRGMRRRLPDIRQVGKTSASTAGNYGPFSLLFGFIWLIFKMIFFTALVLGLGALIGFMVMTRYIKTPEVIVPEISGMKIEEAFEVLSDKKLGVIKLSTESSGLVAHGEIISQQPPPGATAKVNTDVGVVISSGRSQYVVPNVVSETRENALNKIRGARLEVGNLLTIESSSVPRGNVISQEPIGGSGFDEVTKVDLMISAGPPGKSLTMPDLAGISVLEAKAALKAVGIEDVVTEPEDAKPDAKVLNHTPLVGKTVFQTDLVTLITQE